MQHTIYILSIIMMNWTLCHMFMTKFDLFIMVHLSINNSNKEWIVVPFINKMAFKMCIITQSLNCWLLISKIILDNFDYLCCISTTPPTYCNNWLFVVFSMNLWMKHVNYFNIFLNYAFVQDVYFFNWKLLDTNYLVSFPKIQ
jgi:hypothetical protein